MKNFTDCTHKAQVARWENVLRVLQALTPHQRRKHWDMRIFGEKTACGTVACAAGHCEADPWFRRRGFKGKYIVDDGEAILVSPTSGGGWRWFGEDVTRFFGEQGSHKIFMNETRRPVGTVIKEVKAHIKSLTEVLS